MGIFRRKNHRVEQFDETAGAEGFGAPLGIAYGYRDLPGAGALQYAFETLALPMYTPIGWGVANKRSFDPVGCGVVSWSQTIGIQSLIYNGNYTGQIVSAPLVDVDSNTNSPLSVDAFAQSNELPSY